MEVTQVILGRILATRVMEVTLVILAPTLATPVMEIVMLEPTLDS